MQVKLKGILMKESGNMDESMAMVKRLGLMMPDLKEVMKMIRNMVKVFCFQLMAQNFKANLRKESLKVMGVMNGNVAKNITVNG